MKSSREEAGGRRHRREGGREEMERERARARASASHQQRRIGGSRSLTPITVMSRVLMLLLQI